MSRFGRRPFLVVLCVHLVSICRIPTQGILDTNQRHAFEGTRIPPMTRVRLPSSIWTISSRCLSPRGTFFDMTKEKTSRIGSRLKTSDGKAGSQACDSSIISACGFLSCPEDWILIFCLSATSSSLRLERQVGGTLRVFVRIHTHRSKLVRCELI